MTTISAKHILDYSEILINENIIDQTIKQLAEEIQCKLSGLELHTFCIMNGGLYFAGQLLRHLNIPMHINYLHATRYKDNRPTDDLIWMQKPDPSLIENQDILLIDDIFDEGATLEAIVNSCKGFKARSIHSVVLINKQHNRKPISGFEPDFIGLPVEDRYIFGCGMDYKGLWRNLPSIYAVKENC